MLAGATGAVVGVRGDDGLVVNAFQMGIARAGTGLGASARIPISPSLIADQYPIAARTRMFALEALGRPVGQVVGPFLAGAIVGARR